MSDTMVRRGPRIADERSRRAARQTVVGTIRRIPDYLRLLYGMLRDGRVSGLDRGLVLASIAYVLSPLDFIPDVIPFFGQVDDVFLIVLALTRLFEHADRSVVLDHWDGKSSDLSPRALRKLFYAASVFLPPSARRKLRQLASS